MNKPKYRIKPLYMSGKGKKQFRSGQIVSENDFTTEQFHERLKAGDLIEVESDEKEPKKEEPKKESKSNLLNDEPILTIQRDGKDHDVFEYKDITTKEIISELETREIEHDATESKKVLYSLLVEALKQ